MQITDVDCNTKEEADLIIRSMDVFFQGAKDIKAPNMTSLTGALIESLALVMTNSTDADTTLAVLSQVILRLAPQCERGTVQVLPNYPRTKQ